MIKTRFVKLTAMEKDDDEFCELVFPVDRIAAIWPASNVEGHSYLYIKDDGICDGSLLIRGMPAEILAKIEGAEDVKESLTTDSRSQTLVEVELAISNLMNQTAENRAMSPEEVITFNRILKLVASGHGGRLATGISEGER